MGSPAEASMIMGSAFTVIVLLLVLWFLFRYTDVLRRNRTP
ncbi:MAG: hypothetical protein ACTHNU_07910 [Gaiellales bacterium]